MTVLLEYRLHSWFFKEEMFCGSQPYKLVFVAVCHIELGGKFLRIQPISDNQEKLEKKSVMYSMIENEVKSHDH